MKRPKPTLNLWLPVVGWAGFIFYLSGIPYLRITQAWWDIIARKAAHMVVYAILVRLLARAFTGSTFWSWRRIFGWSLLLTLLYANTDEYHQSFVAGRGASVVDVAIDMLGAWMAMGLKP